MLSSLAGNADRLAHGDERWCAMKAVGVGFFPLLTVFALLARDSQRSTSRETLLAAGKHRLAGGGVRLAARRV